MSSKVEFFVFNQDEWNILTLQRGFSSPLK
jgi:hypothetical protein